MSYAEQREREKAVKRAEKKVSETEAEIVRIEAEIAEIETQIAAGVVADDIFTKHAETNKRLENAMSLWELATMEYEEIKNR